MDAFYREIQQRWDERAKEPLQVVMSRDSLLTHCGNFFYCYEERQPRTRSGMNKLKWCPKQKYVNICSHLVCDTCRGETYYNLRLIGADHLEVQPLSPREFLYRNQRIKNVDRDWLSYDELKSIQAVVQQWEFHFVIDCSDCPVQYQVELTPAYGIPAWQQKHTPETIWWPIQPAPMAQLWTMPLEAQWVSAKYRGESSFEFTLRTDTMLCPQPEEIPEQRDLMRKRTSYDYRHWIPRSPEDKSWVVRSLSWGSTLHMADHVWFRWFAEHLPKAVKELGFEYAHRWMTSAEADRLKCDLWKDEISNLALGAGALAISGESRISKLPKPRPVEEWWPSFLSDTSECKRDRRVTGGA